MHLTKLDQVSILIDAEKIFDVQLYQIYDARYIAVPLVCTQCLLLFIALASLLSNIRKTMFSTGGGERWCEENSRAKGEAKMLTISIYVYSNRKVTNPS
jgi:hypothetical protein